MELPKVKTGTPMPKCKPLKDGREDIKSLRDYFAAKAMQAMLSDPMGKFSHVAFSDVSGSAYAMADEMLKEREK